ncbi:hypothetical protein BJ546DRAFT_990249 [Cryomyces antarcticus]
MGSRLESNSNAVRKRIEAHTFSSEDGDEYEGSKFGGFPEYFRRKKIKLQNLDAELRSQTTVNPPIFRGIVAHVNGYTQPSLNDLHKLIVSYGGGFMQYLDGKTTVTHIIASNLTPKKAVEFRRYRIVKPAWIVESVKAGKLLPWDGFRVLDEGVGQKVLGFNNGQVVSQTNTQTKGYRDQSDTSWYTSQLRIAEDTAGSGSIRKPPSFTQTATPEAEEIEDVSHEGQLDDGALGAHGQEEHLLGVPADERMLPSASMVPSFPELHPIEPSSSALFQEPPAKTTKLWTPPLTSPVADNSGEQFQAKRNPTDCPVVTSPVMKVGETPSLKRSLSSRSPSPSKRAKTTAEEHNSILLADPRIRKSTVVHPDFLEQYYRESRLHHLSTWKADLKSQLQALTAEQPSSQRARQKRVPGTRRYILHVDFDGFFAAVSLKKNPEYKDKPAVVAHGGGSGSEIASCNYPAREFGVKNGMWMQRAKELCSELKVLPYDFPAYEEASRGFYNAILATGGIVQSVSIDEALVDVSLSCIAAGGSDGKRLSEGSAYREQAKADEIAQGLRDRIMEKTGCAVSVGIGGNILLAKVALRKAKPAGQYQIKPEEILDFIGKLGVQDLPGVAYSIGGKLEEIGIKFVRDIRDFSREKLISTLGPKTGEKIWDYSRGIDRTEVGEQVVRKSVSAEVNWGVRFETQEQVDEFIENLCGELSKRLTKERVKGRHLTLKIMRRAPNAPMDPPKQLGHGKCDTYNKSVVLGVATRDKDVITKETLSILKAFGFTPGELRGIGVQMTKLEPLKESSDGQVASSQRLLQFKIGGPSKTVDQSIQDPILEDIRPSSPVRQREDPSNDAIQDDVQTPKKGRFRDVDPTPFMTSLLKPSSPSRKPLNILGTQFVLPTQVDPKVLAELPEDIRSRLAKHVRTPQQQISDGIIFDNVSKPQPVTVALPNQSQLDPEILNALPEDVRLEILAFYQKSPRKAREQSLLPQSPRKIRSIPSSKKPSGITRKRGGGLFSRGRNAAKAEGNSTLTQSNFVARPALTWASSHDASVPNTDTEAKDPSDAEGFEEFLSALPDDIRREVLDEQRRSRLQSHGGIDAVAKKALKRAAPKQEEQNPIERLLRLPPRPAKPTFTMKKLSTLPDLRDAITTWHDAFSDEGPYQEDVDALVKYLNNLVDEERDMAKAAAVVKWMAWVVDQGGGGGGGGGSGVTQNTQKGWENALRAARDGVRKAVKARGLGEVEF